MSATTSSSWSCEPVAKPGLWKDLPGWVLDPMGPVSLKLGYLPRLVPWLVKFFAQARATLERFIELYPESFHIEQVKKNLDGLPAK